MFHSFFLAGFECATGLNMHGDWIDQIAATEHDLHVDADYDRLAQVGIHAVREAIRWPLVDRGGRYDFSSVEPFLRAALRHGFDVIWDLFHYGYPPDLDPFSDEFVDRFAGYCGAVARFVAPRTPGVCYFTPVNEPSYFAWAGGEVGRFAPHARGRGFALKLALARAAIRGVAAIREVDPEARIVNVDPICRVVPASDAPAEVEYARRFNDDWVFEFWDIVGGHKMPELGGSPRALDIVGLNYYGSNQWAVGSEDTPLAADDPRRVPPAELVRKAWRRYGHPVVITETSALGEARAPWIHDLSAMAGELLGEGVPLCGICLYPILGMPEWHAREQWARMGLWDLEREQNILERKVCSPMLEALHRARRGNPAGRLAPDSSDQDWFEIRETGGPAFGIRGRLLWHKQHGDGTTLRVFRCDQPYRLWLATVELPTQGSPIVHVETAGDLRMLLDTLARESLGRILESHGGEGRLSAVTEVRWRIDIDELRQCRDELDAAPPLQRSAAADSPIPFLGGGRQ